MSKKENKTKKKPAVGKPAAGSHNKREKTKAKPVKNEQKKKNQSKIITTAEKIKIKTLKTFNLKESFLAFKEKYNLGKIIAVAVVFVSILAICIFLLVSLLSSGSDVPDEIINAEFKGRLETSSAAYDISLSAQQQEALAKAVKIKGNRRAFSFFVNEKIILDEADDPALLEFGSLSDNKCVLVAFLLDKQGNIVYRSLGIEAGKEVKSISFFDEIAYGTQTLTLVVNGYDPKTYEKIGTQTTGIKLEIGVD